MRFPAKFLGKTAFCAALFASTALTPALADSFNRIATFNVIDNLPAGADPKEQTVAEIVTATEDGNTLVYTDSPGQRIGLVDISDPKAPKPAGTVALGGEPTSTAVSKGKALVGVVTSESKAKPSGHLAIIDLATKAVETTCDLGGQPDSVVLSPDKSYLAVVIENERDEEVNEGALPQAPGGNLTIFKLKDGVVDCATKQVADLAGIAAIAPEDPEPEYVDINAANQAVVTLQENNEIALVDLASAKATAHFTAGTVSLKNIDTKKDKVISLSGSADDVAREPDTVQWVDGDRFVTANEGDWRGGTRGFTIFNKDGSVAYDSGTDLEYLAVRLGHYPENRNKKGNEPEGVEVASFGDDRLIFIASERASLVAVYKDEGAGKAPSFLQALPGGIGPEGTLALPARHLFVTAAENDLREDGLIGSVVTIYERSAAPAAYPTIASADGDDGLPIAWAALSGTAADPKVAGKLYAVSDSAYAEARIFTLDASVSPVKITNAITVTKDGAAAKLLDLEGIAVASDGGFWLASEGNPEREKDKTQNLLVKVSAGGVIEQEIALPAEVAATAGRFGFEGVTVSGSGADETVWLAVQREWKNDAKGVVKLIAYKPADQSWGQANYPLEKAEKGWVGLSEVTAVKGGLVLIERDNQAGPEARLKQLTFVSLDGVAPATLGSAEAPMLTKKVVRDLLPDLKAPGGYVLDKVESFAIDAAGEAFVITDNDGVDDSSGETQFIALGKFAL